MFRLSRRAFILAAAGAGLVAAAPVPAAVAGDTTIATTYQEQRQQNWCSAAATRIAISASGRLYTQADLASALGLSSDPSGHGLVDPAAIARLLNSRLGMSDTVFRYFLSQDMDRFDDAVAYGVSVDKPVVYNVDQVAGQHYSAGHYITITGRRTVDAGVQYRISDPDSPERTGHWYGRTTVKTWNKYGRYTSFGYPG